MRRLDEATATEVMAAGVLLIENADLIAHALRKAQAMVDTDAAARFRALAEQIEPEDSVLRAA